MSILLIVLKLILFNFIIIYINIVIKNIKIFNQLKLIEKIINYFI